MNPVYFERVKQLLPLAFLLAIAACGKKRDTALPSISPITESVYANGVIKASGQYTVYPTVNGNVTALLVKEGDTVKAGQPLLRLDDRSSGPAAQSAQAQLRTLEQNARNNGPVLSQLKEAVEQAKDKLRLDSTNYARQQVLWGQQIGSRSELEQRELAFSTSKATFIRAFSALEETSNRLRSDLEVARNNAAINAAGNDDRTPRSLIDGIVYDLRIEPGELATPQKAIAVIGSATDLYLELEVDEKDITRVKPGQVVQVALEIEAGRAFKAEITRIIPIMDERSRTFTVEARFKEVPAILYPNLTVEASIVLREKARALTVPASYIVNGSSVLTGPDERTPVEIGVRDLERVEVLSGIDSSTVLYKP